MNTIRFIGLLLSALGSVLLLSGCVYNSAQPPPPVVEGPSVPIWTPEKEARLKKVQGELEQVREANNQLAEKIKAAQASMVSESEIKALIEERDRLKQRREFLVGEINALMAERGAAQVPYTGNR